MMQEFSSLFVRFYNITMGVSLGKLLVHHHKLSIPEEVSGKSSIYCSTTEELISWSQDI